VQISASLRASDSDREQVAERLRQATAEGRLDGDELEQRLEALCAARTYGELGAVLADLPVNRPARKPRVQAERLIAAVSAVTLILAVLSVLAILRGRAALGVLGTGHPRPLNFPGPLTGPDKGLVIVASLGAVAVVLLSAAALWALMNSMSQRQP
jgi:hypothetical protein